MLSKNFKGIVYYEVTRYYFKHGNEWDDMETTTTVWDTLEKAKAYLERYGGGVKFAGATVEKIVLDREINRDDYKNNDFKIVSFQQVYQITFEWVEDTEEKEVIYMTTEKPVNADEQPAKKNIEVSTAAMKACTVYVHDCIDPGTYYKDDRKSKRRFEATRQRELLAA